MARLRHRRTIQSAAAGVLDESIWPGTAWANLAAFRWRLPMDYFRAPPTSRSSPTVVDELRRCGRRGLRVETMNVRYPLAEVGQ